jgi:5-dehydro-2-deoxygluconokinase
MKADQIEHLRQAYDAGRKVGREVLIEIIAGKHGPLRDDTVARVLDEIYAAGITPDWWKLEPQASPATWSAIETIIRGNDPWCRGVVMLGLEAPADDLVRAFAAARSASMVKGFAVGRTIFADVAKEWFGGRIDDAVAVERMAQRFAALVKAWDEQRQQQVA